MDITALEIIKRNLPEELYKHLPFVINHVWKMDFENNEEKIKELMSELNQLYNDYLQGSKNVFSYYVKKIELDIRFHRFLNRGISKGFESELGNLLAEKWTRENKLKEYGL